MTEVKCDPFVVMHGSKDRMRSDRALAGKAGQRFAEVREGFVRGDNFGRQCSTGGIRKPHAGLHGLCQDSLLQGPHHASNDEGDLIWQTFVGVIDPGGEMVEVLAEGPVAETSHSAIHFSLRERIDVGQDLIDSVESK